MWEVCIEIYLRLHSDRILAWNKAMLDPGIPNWKFWLQRTFWKAGLWSQGDLKRQMTLYTNICSVKARGSVLRMVELWQTYFILKCVIQVLCNLSASKVFSRETVHLRPWENIVIFLLLYEISKWVTLASLSFDSILSIALLVSSVYRPWGWLCLRIRWLRFGPCPHLE